MGLIRKKRSRTDIVSDALHATGTAIVERVNALTPDPKPRKRHTVRRLFGLAVLAAVAYAAARKLRGQSADTPLHVTSAPQSWAPRPVPASPPTPVVPAEDPAEPAAPQPIAPTADETAEAAAPESAPPPAPETAEPAAPESQKPADDASPSETAEPETAEAPVPTDTSGDSESPAEPAPPRKRPAKKAAAARPRSSNATSRPPRKAPAKKSAPKSPPGTDQT